MKRLITIAGIALFLVSCQFIILDGSEEYRNRVVGNYSVEEYSQTYNLTSRYDVWISKSGFGNEVIIDNFYNYGIQVWAEVYYDKITIYRQSCDGFEIEGVGTIYGNRIDFNYSVRPLSYYSSGVDYCESVAWMDY